MGDDDRHRTEDGSDVRIKVKDKGPDLSEVREDVREQVHLEGEDNIEEDESPEENEEAPHGDIMHSVVNLKGAPGL